MRISSSTEKITYRKLSADDLSDYVELWNEAFESDPYAFRTSLSKWKQKTEVEIKKTFYASIRKHNFILGAFSGIQLIGMVGIFNHKGEYTLWGTFVRSAFRGNHVGYDLISKAINILTTENPKAQNLYLEVFSAARAARSMYAKLGFNEISKKATGEILARKNLKLFKLETLF